MGYPWGKEDASLIEFYKKLGQLRKEKAFAGGSFTTIYAKEGVFAYLRQKGDSRVLVAVNRDGAQQAVEFEGTTYMVAPNGWIIEKI